MEKLNGTRHFRLAAIAAIVSFGIPQISPWAASGPCDIYATGGTPCVAAYSTVRTLSSTYSGPLYQVRRTSDSQTKDIPALVPSGFADAAVQDSFLGTGAGTISKLYDQSGKGNNLIKAPAGCYTGTASLPDNESNAKGLSFTASGHKVYALYMIPQDGYRNDTTSGMPTGSQSQGIYEVADGKTGGTQCCWDFGNASTNNCNGGTGNMSTLYFGTGFWGKGAPNGPWFLADLENGVWSGGTGASNAVNTNDPSMTMDYAFGILKTTATTYTIKAGNAQSGNLTTAYNGGTPTSLHWGLHGAIVLGIGGDNSNSSLGTFFEGVITFGQPSDATDSLIFKNVQAAGYGSTATTSLNGASNGAPPAAAFQVRYEPSLSSAVIRYNVPDSRHVLLDVFDHEGRWVARLADGLIPEGEHEAIWNARRAPAGIYVVRMLIDGRMQWAGKIVVEK